jgi:hypothetical protein
MELSKRRKLKAKGKKVIMGLSSIIYSNEANDHVKEHPAVP